MASQISSEVILVQNLIGEWADKSQCFLIPFYYLSPLDCRLNRIARDWLAINNQRMFANFMKSGASLNTKMVQCYRHFSAPDTLRLMGDLPFVAGYIPESAFYQLGIDAIQLGIQISSLDFSSKFCSAVSTAGMALDPLVWDLAPDGESFTRLRSAMWEGAPAVAQEVNVWKKRGNRATELNLQRFLDDGYYPLVLKRTSDPACDPTGIQRRQAQVMLELANFSTTCTLSEDFKKNIDKLTDQMGHSPWVRWHQAIWYAHIGNDDRVIEELTAVAHAFSEFAHPAMAWLSVLHFRKEEFLQAEYWVILATKFMLKTMSTSVSHAKRFAQECDVVGRWFPTETVGDEEEMVYTQRNLWGIGLSGALGMTMGAFKVQRYLLPAAVVGANVFINGDPKQKEKSYAKEYQEVVGQLIGNLTVEDNRDSGIAGSVESNGIRTLSRKLLDSWVERNGEFRDVIPTSSSNDHFSSPVDRLRSLLSRLEKSVEDEEELTGVMNGLEKFISHLSSHKELQQLFLDQIFFQFFHIANSRLYSDSYRIARLAKRLKSLAPEKTRYAALFAPFITFPDFPKGSLSPKQWLLIHYLMPNGKELSQKRIAKALSGIFSETVEKDNIKEFILCKKGNPAKLSETQRFFLGISSLLMAITKAQDKKMLFWLDTAITSFGINPQVEWMAFAKLVEQPNEESLAIFSKVWRQFKLNEKPLFEQLQFYQSLRPLDAPLTLKNLCAEVRSQYKFSSEEELLVRRFVSEARWVTQHHIDSEFVQKELIKGLDPNIPLGTVVTKSENSYWFWTKHIEKMIFRKTLLHVAAEETDPQFFQVLIDFAGDLSKKNLFGLDPIQWMLWTHHQDIQEQGDQEKQKRIISCIEVALDAGYRIEGSLEEFLTKKPKGDPAILRQLRNILAETWDDSTEFSRFKVKGDLATLAQLQNTFVDTPHYSKKSSKSEEKKSAIEREVSPSKYFGFPKKLQLAENIKALLKKTSRS